MINRNNSVCLELRLVERTIMEARTCQRSALTKQEEETLVTKDYNQGLTVVKSWPRSQLFTPNVLAPFLTSLVKDLINQVMHLLLTLATSTQLPIQITRETWVAKILLTMIMTRVHQGSSEESMEAGKRTTLHQEVAKLTLNKTQLFITVHPNQLLTHKVDILQVVSQVCNKATQLWTTVVLSVATSQAWHKTTCQWILLAPSNNTIATTGTNSAVPTNKSAAPVKAIDLH